MITLRFIKNIQNTKFHAMIISYEHYGEVHHHFGNYLEREYFYNNSRSIPKQKYIELRDKYLRKR
jgi:hypothetical protein